MNINFELSKEEATRTDELLNELREAEDKNLSARDNIVAFYNSSRPDAKKGEAEETADKIIRGVTSFTQNFQELKEQNEDFVFSKLDKAMEDLPLEKQYACMAELLFALKSVDAQVLSSVAAETEYKEKLEKLRESIVSVKEGVVAQKMVDELAEQTKEAMKNSAICIAGNAELAQLIESLPGNPDASQVFAEENWEDAKYKAYASMVTYIAYLNMEIPSLPENTDAEMIAVGISAGIERDKVIRDAGNGTIAWDKAMEVLQFIGMAVLICAGIWAAFQIISGAIVIGAVIGAFLGGSLLSICVCMVMGGYLGCLLVGRIHESLEPAINWVAGAYRTSIEFFRDHIAPKCADAIRAFWRFIDERIIQGIFRIGVKDKQAVSVNG